MVTEHQGMATVQLGMVIHQMLGVTLQLEMLAMGTVQGLVNCLLGMETRSVLVTDLPQVMLRLTLTHLLLDLLLLLLLPLQLLLVLQRCC